MTEGLVPGEVDTAEKSVTIDQDRKSATVNAANAGDRPVQVEPVFPDGTRLVTVHGPTRSDSVGSAPESGGATETGADVQTGGVPGAPEGR